MNPLPDYEKLGAFYLGKEYDLARRERTENVLLYDSKDLVTHAVCVGMTGSGKTGLCIGLIEEAAIDGIPSIIIDPKGDLSNLLLTFPELKGEDFAPWINEEDGRKKGMEPAAFAAAQAELWKKGLESWQQDGARVKRLKDAAEFAIYTPGSTAGLQVSVLKSFDCPSAAVVEDAEIFRERVAGTTTSLLGLLGEETDPQSREHIFLSTIFAKAWGAGESLDLAALIQRIQNPPFTKIGVMELESVYGAKDRFALALKMNNLIASPGFAAWTEGETLDIGSMLFTAKGKPRVAIFSIAHLDDAQRMFFVSLLLNQMLSWVRTQSGTNSLRALLYMDEIAGYFPPVANPPSKQPILTLMKQARAFGVGCVLATQNPVDIDYKGLSNAGTWFIGRLQTQRDKDRVLDGLEGAAAQASTGGGFDRTEADRALSALGPRVFLMNNVHEDHPVIFETRWCLSYLRGPLTRQQIRQLSAKVAGAEMQSVEGAVGVAQKSEVEVKSTATTTSTKREGVGSGGTSASGSSRPVLPPEIPQYFLPVRASGEVQYVPALLGFAKVYYTDAKLGIDVESEVCCRVRLMESGVASLDWDEMEFTDVAQEELETEPAERAKFAALHPEVAKAKVFESWKKGFLEAVFRKHTLEVWHCAQMGVAGKPGESEREFRARLGHVAREERDAMADKVRAKYASRLRTLADRSRRAEQAIEVQKEQASHAKTTGLFSIGSVLLSFITGRKAVSGALRGAASAAGKISRTSKEEKDVARAEDNFEAIQKDLKDLEAQVQEDINKEMGKVDAAAAVVEKLIVRPKKTNVQVKGVVLCWEGEGA